MTDTTTRLADRLPELLDELACSTPVDDDDTFIAERLTLVDDDGPGRSRRRLLTVAATAMIIGAGVTAVATSGREARPEARQSPSAPTAGAESSIPASIPVLDPLPAAAEPSAYPHLAVPPDGLEITARLERIGPSDSELFTESLLARRDGDRLTDTVSISVQAEPYRISPVQDRPPTTATVLGLPATVYDYGVEIASPVVHVTWGSGPYFLATGADPLTFLGQLTPESLLTAPPVSDDLPVSITFGPLPPGYEVITPPQAVGVATTSATLAIGADNVDVAVGTRSFVPAMAQAGPLRQVDVNGTPAWVFDDSEARLAAGVAWSIDDTTHVYVKINDGRSTDDALAIARALDFVDEDTWIGLHHPS